ncbi:hypothetical protein HDU96_003490, partial [Phlyctochytrium bullatum]
MAPPPAPKRHSRIPRAVSQPPRRTPPPTQSPEQKEEERVITTQAGDTPISPPRRSRRLAGQGPEVKPLPLTVTRRAIPTGKVRKTRLIFESARSTTPSPNPNPKPVIAIVTSTPPADESIANGLQNPPVDSPALMTITTAANVSDQPASPLSATQLTHPSLDAPANPFLALSATPIAPLAAVHLPPAIASPPGMPAGRETPIPVHDGDPSHVHRVQVLDLSRTGTPGPAKTPLTGAELIGFDPLAPAETPTSSRSPLALASGSHAHRGALIKAAPKAKSFPAPPASHPPLKNSFSPPMPIPPASTGQPYDGRRATSPSFTPPSPPSYAPASPSTAAVWRTLFGDSSEPELSRPHDAETERETSPPLATAMSDHDDDKDDVKDELDNGDPVKSESDDSWWPDNASSPSPTPPPPRAASPPPRPLYTTARRTGGRPLPPRPTAPASTSQPAALPATPAVAARPRTAGAPMPPTRLHAEPAHRTAKSAAHTNPLGPARTVAFKAAPPAPMMTRARAAAAQQAATPSAQPPLVSALFATPPMVTRSRARATAAVPATHPLPADPMRGI